jgi:DsbC/DsbD-like thiol-disulfide interchange protein
MKRIALYSVFLVPLLAPTFVLAQDEERMTATVSLDAKQARPGATITAKVRFDIKPGFHCYPTKQKDPKMEAFATTIRIKNGDKAPVQRAGDIKEPKPKEKHEPELGTLAYYEGTVEFEVPLKVKANAPTGPAKFTLAINTQVCDEKGCLPYSKSFDLEVNVRR